MPEAGPLLFRHGVETVDMKILLKDEGTGLFYFGHGFWTPSQGQAFDFHSGDHALSVARQHEIAKGEMIFDFEDPQINFSIPVAC